MTIVGHGALLLLANALLLVAGAGLTRALGVWSAPAELRRVLGLSFAAGLAGYGVLAQLLYVCGLSLSLWEDLLVVAAFAAAGALGGGRRSGWPQAPSYGRAEILAAAAVAVLLVALGVDALVQPLLSWDAWTQWTPKATGLVVMHGLDPHVFGSTVYRHWHIDYPLLVPAVAAYGFRFIGLDTRAIHLEYWCFFAAFAWAFVDLLRPRVRPLYVWTTLLAIVFAPRLLGQTIAANADVPLACFLGLAGIAALIWLTERDRAALALLALFGAAAVATKVEGTYLFAVIVVVTALFAARTSRTSGWLTIGAGLLSLVGILPWRIWVAANHLPSTYSLHDALTSGGWHDRSRGPISTLVVVGELFSPSGWLLLVPLAIAAVAVVATRGGRRLPVLVAGAGLLVAASLVSALAIPGPTFPFPWRVSDWALLLPLVLGAALLGAGLRRAGGPATWTLLCAGAMTATFLLVYVLTPFPFAWLLSTSSARVVMVPGLFVGAVLPLLLGRAAVSER